MYRPITVIVTSNKGGSGKTPIAINLAIWGLSQNPPLKVLVVDINHTNQDFFQAMQHISPDNGRSFETAFTLEEVGTAYYLPLSDNLHLVRSQAFQPLTAEQFIEIVTKSVQEYARQHGKVQYIPDLIVVDSNYCFPSYRLRGETKTDSPAFIFLNIWSITSPHELRLPKDYRTTINHFKVMFDEQDWDRTHFIHVFSVLEKERKLTSEVTKVFSRGLYTVPGSDDLAALYKKRVLDDKVRSVGYSFDQIQREVFSPLLAELDSLMVEDPKSYSEDTINARWVERVNIFLTQHNEFPLNLLPMPHYYPFLRKAVVDMILRERLDLDLIRGIFSDFYKWVEMYLNRFFKEFK